MAFYDFPKDFITRTLFNLGFIEENKRDEGPHEVTQLVNSMLGLLIVPKELGKKRISGKPYLHKKLTEITDLSLPDELLENDGLVIFIKYIQHLRNSLAHGRFWETTSKNESTGKYEISGFYFYDAYKHKITMDPHYLTLDLLQQIVFKYLYIAYEIDCKKLIDDQHKNKGEVG